MIFDETVLFSDYNYDGDAAVKEMGIKYLESNLSCFPIRWKRDENGKPNFIIGDDGGKDKDLVFNFSWDRFKIEVISTEEFELLWVQKRANTLAVVTGNINHIYCIDFDLEAVRIFPLFLKAIADYVEADQLYIERTISGGFHLFIKLTSEIPATTHYAMRPGVAKPLIESKGAKGIVFTAPSYGYHAIPGFASDLTALKEMATETFNKIEAVARTFDERPAESVKPSPSAQQAVTAGTRPGDDYNKRATMESMLMLLQKHGWVEDHTDAATGNVHLTRPGKSGGTSATLRLIDNTPIFYVFSSSCSEFEPEVGYNPYNVYAKLEHNGDYRLAARTLAAFGFGTNTSDLRNVEETAIFEGIELRVDKKGHIINDLTTVKTILNEDPKFIGMAKFNELSSQTALVKQVGYLQTGALLDKRLRAYIISDICDRYNGLRIKEDDLKIALLAIYNAESYNPFRDFVDSCEWDGKPRVDTLLIDCFDCDDTPLARESIRNWLIAAYARQIQPGMKFDYALTLTGVEGLGKSGFVKLLFDPLCLDVNGWNVDAMHLKTLTEDKTFVEGSRGKVGIELAEFAGSRKVEVEELKSALTKCHRLIRKAYGEESESFLVRQVFLVTTNEEAFLASLTGNRRFWIVNAKKCGVFDVLNTEYVKQVWGEVRAMYNARLDENGRFNYFCLELSKEAMPIALEAQQNARITDPWEGNVAKYLGAVSRYTNIKKVDGGFEATPVYTHKDAVRSQTVWDGIYSNNERIFTSAEGRKLASFMRNKLGWEKGLITDIDGARANGYKRPAADYDRVFIPIDAVPAMYRAAEHTDEFVLNAEHIIGYKTTPKYWNY